ncbi:MAG: DNA methyltransferase [Candidatus Auribacterota bacterium]|jgi:hypothetical protein|nr:DNA methyltransferase [Candidatus Auribacterota bacterium]
MSNHLIEGKDTSELLTIKEASEWASQYLKKNVSVSNISYLIQYGCISKIGNNGSILVSVDDLKKYYSSHVISKKNLWKQQLGDDLNWELSFAKYRESETTKHVHRLHPYKGKFIPQLVEYFLDTHTDNFKREIFFKAGDIILDPFCGSGTTLVQSNELGLHAIGIDISRFNSFISNSKIKKYDLANLRISLNEITKKLKVFQNNRPNSIFEKELLEQLKIFNDKYFPSPQFRYKVRQKQIDEKVYGSAKEQEFIVIYNALIAKHGIKLSQNRNDTFLEKWFIPDIREEIDFVFNEINNIQNTAFRDVASLILSRTMRSCRATTHSDLATLLDPVTSTYYCKKHGKICKPLFSILSWWERYAKDTYDRISKFDRLRTDSLQICLTGDSRTIDIFAELNKSYPDFSKLLNQSKIRGIFSSPPYVGLINYHEQHAYAYDLFGFERNDNFEIGSLYRGQGKDARDSYVSGISSVLKNCKKYLSEDYDIFLVANDKFNLFPEIAALSSMKIVNTYKRPVLNRVEKDRNAYCEIIFHIKEL